MKKILVIDDENIAQKILEEFSEEICIMKKTEVENSNQQMPTLNYKNITLYTENYEVYVDGKKISLTTKEFDILKLLINNKNKVFSRENLLNSVWGYDYFGDPKIINTHIKNIRKKLGVDCIETVRGVGYKI